MNDTDGVFKQAMDDFIQVETYSGYFVYFVRLSYLLAFLQAQKDLVLVHGVPKKKGDRSSIRLDDTEEQEIAPSEVDIKKERLEQEERQREWAEDVKEIEELAAEQTLEAIINSQEYLREVSVKEEWDCETIISTYSTLDNNPRLIKDPKTKFKPFMSLKMNKNRNQDDLSDSRSVGSSVHATTTNST